MQKNTLWWCSDNSSELQSKDVLRVQFEFAAPIDAGHWMPMFKRHLCD